MVVTKTDGSEDRLLLRGLTTGEEVANPVHGMQGAESFAVGRNAAADRIVDEPGWS
jgi:hypothetical protein